MSLKGYPKIDTNVKKVFKEKYFIAQEKVDGSMFAFGYIDGALRCRSKRNQINLESPDSFFQIAVDYIKSIEDKIAKYENRIFYCEYLQKPKHNVLAYDKTPKNNLMMFDCYDIDRKIFVYINEFADALGIDSAPVLADSYNAKKIKNLLELESYLGGQKIEGVVVKSYNYGDETEQIKVAKYVSPRFKEIQKGRKPKTKITTEEMLKEFFDLFKNENRWAKALIHLKEQNLITGEVEDIPKLIKEIQRDVLDEEEQYIKSYLYKMFKKSICITAVKGCAEWYKDKLANGGI